MFVRLTMNFSRPFTSSFRSSLLQMIDGVMYLALCLHVVFQAPQRLRFSKKQTICEGCFAHHYVCFVIPPHSGMSRAVHPQEFPKVDVSQWQIPVWASYFDFPRWSYTYSYSSYKTGFAKANAFKAISIIINKVQQAIIPRASDSFKYTSYSTPKTVHSVFPMKNSTFLHTHQIQII